MYVYSWLGLVVVSLWISLAAFIWGLQSGQFKEQARVRYFPLRDQTSPAPLCDPAKVTVEVYVLAAIVTCGLLIMLTPLALTIWHSVRG